MTMSLKASVKRLEQALTPPQEQEPHVIIIRCVGRAGPSPEEIEAAKAEARQQGNPVCMVIGGAANEHQDCR